jgi:hypothetical protein
MPPTIGSIKQSNTHGRKAFRPRVYRQKPSITQKDPEDRTEKFYNILSNWTPGGGGERGTLFPGQASSTL